MRELLAIHAAGMGRALRNEGNLAARERAFTMTAELLLMQHSCHWFCKSKTVASARMLAMFHRLAPALQPLGLPFEALLLSAHGSWRAVLAGGAAVELGQGEAPELLQRLQRLTGTLTQIAQRQGRRIDQLEYADLRYANGYALRLKGVTTLSGEAPAPARRAAPKNQRG